MKLPKELLKKKKNKVPIILQARVGSTRYRGKVLEKIKGKTLLEHIFDRFSMISGEFYTILAIPDTEENNILEEIAKYYNIPVVRGPEEDVLKRYVLVIKRFYSPYYIRATADNPLFSWDTAKRILECIITKDADYVVEKELPLGGALEIFTREALLLSDKLAYLPEDREHVTLFIKKNPKLFKVIYSKTPDEEKGKDLRITVDTEEDMKRVKKIYEQLYDGKPIDLKDVIKFLKEEKVEK